MRNLFSFSHLTFLTSLKSRPPPTDPAYLPKNTSFIR